MIRNQFASLANITEHQKAMLKTLHELRSVPNLNATKPDKGNGVVLLDSNYNFEKVTDILKDHTKITKMSEGWMSIILK